MPIPCGRCGIMIRGTERQRQQNNKIITECTWRCYKCGSFIKQGITKMTDVIK